MGHEIVCGVDGPRAGSGAAAFTAHLAQQLGAKAVLVHIEPVKPLTHAPRVSSIAKARELGRLRALTEQHPFPRGTSVYVDTGDPPAELERMADEHDADLVVVGTRGLREVGAAVLGGVSSVLMRTAPCPVVVVPEDASLPSFGGGVGPVVCGVSGDERDRDLLRLGADLATRLGGSLHAVHAYDPTPTYAMAGAFAPPVVDELREAADAILARAQSEAGVTARPWAIQQATPAAALKEVAERGRAGLVVVGSRGRGRLGCIWHGSVAVQVAAEASCPLVVLPPEARLGAGSGHYELSPRAA